MASELSSFLEDDELLIPGVRSRTYPDGHDYVVSSPDAETGLWLAQLASLTMKARQGGTVSDDDLARIKLDDDQEMQFMHRVLGATFDQMVADGVSWVRLKRVMQYAYIYFAFSPEDAQRALEAGVLEGKAPTPANRAQRRATTRSGRPDSPASSKKARKR